jgi:hypothetical protein
VPRTEALADRLEGTVLISMDVEHGRMAGKERESGCRQRLIARSSLSSGTTSTSGDPARER